MTVNSTQPTGPPQRLSKQGDLVRYHSRKMQT
jgi:hypothetical protein